MRIDCYGHATYLVEAAGLRLLVDPWLTPRLDRMWVHWPPVDSQPTLDSVDAIFLSHHHFDHHHFPSLDLLPRSAALLFPRPAPSTEPSRSGMGHEAIAWTLRRLGFSSLHPLDPLTTLSLGDLRLTTLPSQVPFPELGLLIEAEGATVLLAGDSMLHEATRAFFALDDSPKVDLAFLPCHSVAPSAPLGLRAREPDLASVRAAACANFDAWVDAVHPRRVVPSAFGWRVETQPGEDALDWLNHALFVLTPAQAAQRLRSSPAQPLLLGPGDRVELHAKVADVAGPYADEPGRLVEALRAVELDPSAEIPPLRSRAIDRGLDGTELAQQLADAWVDSDAWIRSVCDARPIVLEILGDDTERYLLEPWRARPLTRIDAAPEGIAWTRVLAGALKELLSGELLYESSYGLWTGTSPLLAAAFHQHRFYIRHVEAWLRERDRA